MEYASGNIYIRHMVFDKAGDIVEGHKHNFDHHTLCVRGAVKVKRTHPDGRTDEAEQVAGDLGLLIKAECTHELIATKDDTLCFCIYAHRVPQADGSEVISQHYTGWENAYL